MTFTSRRALRTFLLLLASASLLATACTTEPDPEAATPIVTVDETDEPVERTSTSIGLSPDGQDNAALLAFVEEADEERIEVPADDPAIEPFVFFAEEFGTREQIDGLDLYRGRPTLITFSVPSCPVCVAEAPDIAGAAERFPDITYVMVHSQGTDEEIADFIDDAQMTADNIVHLHDEDLMLWSRFGVVQQPTSILVDANGRVTSTRGALAPEGLEIVAAMLELRDPPSFDHLSPERPTNPDA